MIVIEGRFTVECRRIFGRATSLAKELGHPAVGTEHLLLAMLEVPSTGAHTLATAGAGPDRVRAEVAARTHHIGDDEALALLGIDAAAVRSHIEAAFGPDALDEEPPWTDLARQVLVDAVEHAEGDAGQRDLPAKERVVGTDWLFLALLDHDEGVAAQVIEALGVDQAAARGEIVTRVPLMVRFRREMLASGVHGRYRAILATWAALDVHRKAVTREVVVQLHDAHDQVLVDVVGMLGVGVSEDEMIAAYFTAIERPVGDAALAMAALGVDIG